MHSCWDQLPLCAFISPLIYFAMQTSYTPETGDIEPFVRQLCTDLKDIETVMVGALWTDKCRYLFDGLGHFIYTILLKSAFAISQINKKGVNKMCVLGCEASVKG